MSSGFFLSLEVESTHPSYIDWVIIGGESGSKGRPMEQKWVVNIQEQCQAQGIKFFFVLPSRQRKLWNF